MSIPGMSRQSERGRTERLLAFEIREGVYALPITSVLEVAEAERVCCIPSVARSEGAVINWHGDALPVVAPDRLLGTEEAEPAGADPFAREHVLVVSDVSGSSARLGLPIDRVLGLLDSKPIVTRGRALVLERRPVDGRVVSVLDPGALTLRAIELIEQSAH